MNEPVQLSEITRETLHRHWPFIETGLKEIIRKVSPDWIVPDVYAALSTGHTNCVLAQRGGKDIGFVVYYRQPRPFSMKPDLFIWAAYSIPFKHRSTADNVPEVVELVWRYLANTAKSNFGTSVIAWITTPSRARAFKKKYGWSPSFVTFHTEV